MTQRQKRVVASISAIGTILGSFAFWTAIISAITPDYSISGKEHSVWNGALNSMGAFVESVTETVQKSITEPFVEQMHMAASTVTSVSEEVSVSEEENPRALGLGINSPDTLADELSQWEILSAYTLSIPSISLEAPVLFPSMRYWDRREWDLLEKQMQIGLNHGTVAYPHSVVPGNPGTFFLAGHSSPPGEFAAKSDFGRVFARIPELEPGDKIILSVKGQTRTYEVQGAEIIPSSATEILKQQNNERLLKIITCFPVGTTKDRMVVTAKLVE